MSERGSLSSLTKRAQVDSRTTPIHMSFLLAVFCCWEESNWHIPIRYRKNVIIVRPDTPS